MEYLIFTACPLGIELGLFAIIAGIIYEVVRNIKNKKAHEEKQN